VGGRDRVAAVLVAVTLAVAAFAIGSAPRWAVCITAALCMATAVPLVTSRRRLDERPLLLVLLAMAIGFTAIQLIPLPSGLLAFLSPHRWNLVVENHQAWGTEPPDFVPLTYDFPQTLVELTKLVGYLAFAYTAIRLAESTRARRFMLSAAVLVGGAMAATAIAHKVVRAKTLFGVYEPEFNPPPYLAPLLNANHLCALLAFCAPVCAGLAAVAVGSKRAIWIGTGLLTAGVCFLAGSRGGAIALVVGGATAGWLLFLQHRRGLSSRDTRLPRNVWVPALVILACSLALLVAFTAGGVAQELSQTTTEELSGEDYKLEVWRSSRSLMYRHPWTGVGRGGFEFAFARFHPSGEKTYSHVENEYLQFIIDWGAPAAAAMGVVLALMAIAISRRRLVGPLEAGAIGGLVALGLHNFVDFNLEFPAIALPAICAIAVLLPGQMRATRGSARRYAGIRSGALVAGAVVLVVTSSPVARQAKVEAAELEERLDESLEKIPGQELVDDAIELTDRHPSDYLSFGLAARALFRKGENRAIEILNRALDLNPEHSGVHWMAAQMLASTSRGRRQALIEYELALRTAQEPRVILAELLVHFPKVEDAVRALPLRSDLAERIAYEFSVLERGDIALAYAEKLHKEMPESSDMAGLVTDYALLRGKIDLAVETGKKAYDKDRSPRNAVRWGRALVAAKRPEEAANMLDTAMQNVRAVGNRNDLLQALILLADVQRERKRAVEARDTLIHAMDLAAERDDMIIILRALAVVEEALGNPHSAEVARERASHLDLSDDLKQEGAKDTPWWTKPPPATPAPATPAPATPAPATPDEKGKTTTPATATPTEPGKPDDKPSGTVTLPPPAPPVQKKP
jgi:tetratricopeptide (TPR) repeat protein